MPVDTSSDDVADDPETAPVEIRLLAYQPTPRHASLIGLLDVELTIYGVPIELRGCQIRAVPGRLELFAPHYRAGGTWRAAVRLDDAIWIAILDEFRLQVPDPAQASITTTPPVIFSAVKG